jgi:hypothetical protein
MKRLYNIPFKFTCDAEKFGFCKTLNIELDLDLEAILVDYDGNLSINNYTVMWAEFNPKIANGLQTFVSKSDEGDIWLSLREEQQQAIHSWITEKLKEKEIVDKVKEEVTDRLVSEAERFQERLSER